MPTIKPFAGIVYNPEKVNLGDVVAPPYDVISPDMRSALYERSPHNIIRLILGREPDPYLAAAETLRKWRDEEILVRDRQETLYIVAQRFTIDGGATYERTGFIAACELEEFGRQIHPHERTLSTPKEDRMRLLKATGAMYSQIFSVYADPHHVVDDLLDQCMANPPALDIGYESVRNRVWKLTDTRMIERICGDIAGRPVFVADGHHRYETALAHRRALEGRNPTGKHPWMYVPMFLTNMHHPGMLILPTHRLLHSLPEFDPAAFLRDCEADFSVEQVAHEAELIDRMKSGDGCTFGVVSSGGSSMALLRLRNGSAEKTQLPSVLAGLDVSILHTMIFGTMLHISDADQIKKRYLDYVKDARSAVAAVRSGKYQAAFLMNPTKLDQVRAVAESGHVLPQKSTYFYPKLLSGIVTYSFRDE